MIYRVEDIEVEGTQEEIRKFMIDNGFYLTEKCYEKLLERKLDLQEKCQYCKNIEASTNKSPRKKYIYCPMCGRKR